MKGYKGFDKDLRCKGVQYEVGKTVEHKGELSLCNSGLHYCENPLDCLSYYPPTTSRYAEVEAEGVSDKTGEDSKRVASSILVKAEITLKAMIEASIKFVFARTKVSDKTSATSGRCSPSATSGRYSPSATSGRYSPSATSGRYSPSATSGRCSPSATSGWYSPSATSGECSPAYAMGRNSIAAAIGIESSAKAALGNWIVCAEWKIIDDEWAPVCVKTAKVDGKKIKADVFYTLKGGKFVEAKP